MADEQKNPMGFKATRKDGDKEVSVEFTGSDEHIGSGEKVKIDMEKGTVEFDDSQGFMERAMIVIAEAVAIIGLVVALVVGIASSQSASAAAVTILRGTSQFLRDFFGRAGEGGAKLLGFIADTWENSLAPMLQNMGGKGKDIAASVSRWSKTFGLIFVAYIVVCLFFIGLTWFLDMAVGTATVFGLLAFIPLSLVVFLQYFVRKYEDNVSKHEGQELYTSFSFARVPSIIYLSTILIGAFFLYWDKVGKIFPPEVELGYTIVGIVFCVLTMSSFSVLLMRRRNNLFRAWVWVTVILLIASLFMQIPRVDQGVTRFFTAISTGLYGVTNPYEEYEVVAESLNFRQFSSKKIAGSKSIYDPNEIPEVAKNSLSKNDLVVLDKSDRLEITGQPHLFFFARMFKEGQVVAEGYVPDDDRVLRPVNQPEPEAKDVRPEQPVKAAGMMVAPAPVVVAKKAKAELVPETEAEVTTGFEFQTSEVELYPASGTLIEYGPFTSRQEVLSVQVMIGFHDQNNDGVADSNAIISPKPIMRSGGHWVGLSKVDYNNPDMPDPMMFRSDEPLTFTVKLNP